MSEKIIKMVISIIPTILIIACVGAAFATHDWNMQATILGENPLQALERLMPSGLAGDGGEEFLEVTDVRLSEDGTKLFLEAALHSPLAVPVTIKELTAEVELEGSTVAIHLPEEVAIPAQGSVNVTLEGSLPVAQTPSTLPSAEAFTLDRMEMTLDIGGIELKLGNLGLGGAG
jgi:hypothetical protein